MLQYVDSVALPDTLLDCVRRTIRTRVRHFEQQRRGGMRSLFDCLNTFVGHLLRVSSPRYREDDGQAVEPTFFVPVIPMILVNGAKGIATGWSTDCPTYNPRDIIAQIRRHLNGQPVEAIHPWYRGFRGTVTPVWPGGTPAAAAAENSEDAVPTAYECRGKYTLSLIHI